ncbi:hypothetical protein F4780DRAFT_782780 [Xylariomycetidae sp. FL0641]|nr:hypothetical protein F4780DRAFT_782780 [Xylariomycetidae sp. FL0641]
MDLGAALSAITRDIAREFMLDKTYGSLKKEDFNVAIALTKKLSWRITKHVRWFGPTMRALPPEFVMKTADEGTVAFFEYLQETEEDTKRLLGSAATDKDASRTIVHAIADSKLPESEKRFESVINEVATVTGAGFETTASVV